MEKFFGWDVWSAFQSNNCEGKAGPRLLSRRVSSLGPTREEMPTRAAWRLKRGTGTLKLDWKLNEKYYSGVGFCYLTFHCSFFYRHIPLLPFFSWEYIQGGTNVDCEYVKQSLFLHYYLLIIVLFFHTNNCKPTFAPQCICTQAKITFHFKKSKLRNGTVQINHIFNSHV